MARYRQIDQDTPLRVARAYVEQGRADGVRCPCCDRLVKDYRRKIHWDAAAALVTAYRKYGLRPFHGKEFNRLGGDWARLRHWGLLHEPSDEPRPDGRRSGWWRVTEHGRDFVQRYAVVPTYILLSDNELVGFDGPDIDIDQALTHRFDLRELLRPVPRVVRRPTNWST